MKKNVYYAVFACTSKKAFTKDVIDECLYFNSPEYGKLFRNKEDATEFARERRASYTHGRQYSRCTQFATRYVVRKVDEKGKISGVAQDPEFKSVFSLAIQD
jgi:hypothetical protein